MSDTTNHKINPILPFKPSTLETIDFSIHEWLNDTMDLHCSTNEGWKKLPVVWVSGERSGQRANQVRTRGGQLTFPILTLERSAVTKDPTRKGYFYGNIPAISYPKGGSITIARRIQQNKTANFLNAASAHKYGDQTNAPVGRGQLNFPSRKPNRKIVYETLTVPMPVYLDITYTLNIQTEYQQQMNELVQPLATITGGINSFWSKKDGHKYECFMQPDFAFSNNVAEMGQDRRVFITTVTIKTLGYVIGGDKNQDTPTVAIRENAVDVKIPRERVIFGDATPWKNGKYRE